MGLEQPCCDQCNKGSRWFEDIASFLGSVQIYDADGPHFEKKLRHLIRYHPDAYREMMPSPSQRRRQRHYADGFDEAPGLLGVDGPIVSKALSLYGAKLALALHANCVGQALSVHGKVSVYTFTNVNMIEDTVPKQLFEHLPERKTLKQGRKHVGGQFQFASRKTIEEGSSAHWVLFGSAFGYLLFASESMAMSFVPAECIFRPGCMTEAKPVSIGLGPVNL